MLRRETDTTSLASLPGGIPSPDGSQLAYWSGDVGAALHVSASDGTADRVVTTLADRRPGGIAWSTDGTGLLISTAAPDPRFLVPRVLSTVDLGTAKTHDVYTGIGPSGASVVPLIWRRDAELYVAYETGPGGFNFGYTVIVPGRPPVRTDPDADALGFTPSPDGSLVIGTWLRDSTVRMWPADDFAKQTVLRPAAGEQIATPRWWPGRAAIAYETGRNDGGFHDIRVERWDPATGVREILKRLPDRAFLGGFLIREDGTGLLTQGSYPPAAWEVTDLRTGVSTPIPLRDGEVVLRTALIR